MFSRVKLACLCCRQSHITSQAHTKSKVNVGGAFFVVVYFDSVLSHRLVRFRHALLVATVCTCLVLDLHRESYFVRPWTVCHGLDPFRFNSCTAHNCYTDMKSSCLEILICHHIFLNLRVFKELLMVEVQPILQPIP